MTLLEQAEAYQTRNAGSKPIAMTSREAVQTAEDARSITLKGQAEARLEQERAASAGRVAQANRPRQIAEADADDADAARTRRSRHTRRARTQAARASRSRGCGSRGGGTRRAGYRSCADVQRSGRAERPWRKPNRGREKQELRTRLIQQLNVILQTRDSARGLIVNMSDVLFDSGNSRSSRARVKSCPRSRESFWLIQA